ncbi:hypothetical protein LUZ60_012099 [Juncus effusus]|nr:hypothetical protein LUZ60_012099 [Juncus effusus]
MTDGRFKEINRVLKPERKLRMSGYVYVQAIETPQSAQIKGKKASWTAGTSFPIKIATKTLPKIEITDESNLIDEESLLTEEDFTRKACKSCACGRAEEEKKVEKLGFTAEQINNPQSTCVNVIIILLCGMEDAFRSSGFPYNSFPPFKIGEKVTLVWHMNDWLIFV